MTIAPPTAQPIALLINCYKPATVSAPSFIGQSFEYDDRTLKAGSIVTSPGGLFQYRVLGACCRLYDREELSYPSCRLSWRSREPSWNRVGRRFVPDLSSMRSPSYMVEIVGSNCKPFVCTLRWQELSVSDRDWWYSKRSPKNLETWRNL